MTAIVAGQGLGLINTSLGLLGDQGQLGVASQGRSGEKVVVNAANGNLVIQQQDEWLVGIGPDVVAQRTYNSQANSGDDDNGDNWRLGLSRKVFGLAGGSGLNTVDSTIQRMDDDGHISIYRYDRIAKNYVCTSGAGSFDTLSYDTTAKKWTWTDGNSRTTEVYGLVNGSTTLDSRLETVADVDGNKFTLSYASATSYLITKIDTASASTGSGESVAVIYDTVASKTNNILSLTTTYKDSVGVTQSIKRVSYTYDTNNRLSQVRVDLTPANTADAKVYVTAYTYDDASGISRRVKTLVESDGSLDGGGNLIANSKLSFNYDTSATPRVISVQETIGAEVRTTSFDYSVVGQTKITDPLSQVTTLQFDTTAYSATTSQAGQLLKITTPAVNSVSQVTSFTYDASGNVTTITDPRGNVIIYRYDAQGNRVYERDAQGDVIERSFNSSNKVLSETVYTGRDTDGDGALLASGGLTTNYYYDVKGHLRFVVSPEGRVTENQYNATGQRISTFTYSDASYAPAGLGSWAQDFSAGASGFSPTTLPTGFSVSGGQLNVRNTYVTTGTTYPFITSGAQPMGTNWRAEFTTPTGQATGCITIGIDDGTSRHAVNIINGDMVARANLGATAPTIPFGTTKPSTTYVLEINTQADGSSELFVYEKGKERSSGYSDLRKYTSWLAPKFYISTESGNSYTTASSVGTFLIDNVSAVQQTGESDLATWAGNRKAAAANAAQWTQDFTSDTSGLRAPNGGATLPTGFALQANGTLTVTTTTATAVDATVYGAPAPLGASLKTEITTPANILTGNMTIGFESGQWGYADYVRHAINITAGVVDLKAWQGPVTSHKQLTPTGSTIKASTTYVLEIVTQPDGTSQLYFYEKGLARNSLYVDTQAFTKWKSPQFFMDTWVDPSVQASTVGSFVIDNLSVTSPYTSVQRTDYTYNARGQLDKQITYGSVSGSTATGVTDGTQSITQFVYDQAGNLLKQIDGRNYVTSYSYDGLNRVISQTDGVGTLSSTTLSTSTYDDVNLKTVVTLANGLSTTSTYDQGGHLLSVAKANGAQALGTTSYTYDKLGRLVATATPTGEKSYILYDEASRKVAEIDAENELTEYRYNAANQLVATVRYANRVDTAKIVGDGSGLLLSNVRPTLNPTDDRTNRVIYDKAGRTIKTIDALGAVVEYRYDGAGRLTDTLAYLTVLTPGQLSTISSATTELSADVGTIVAGGSTITLTTHVNDRRTRSFYGNDGLQIGTLDADNYYSNYSYDTAGRLTKTTRYASQMVGTLADGNTPPPVLSAASGNNYVLTSTATDLTTYNLYNARNQLIATLDAEYYYTTYQYDAAGNKSGQVRYKNRVVNAFDGKTPPVVIAQASTAPTSPTSYVRSDLEDQYTTYAYDADNRLLTSTELPNGLTTSYTYDKVGNVTKTVRAVGVTDDERTSQRRYDALGRVTAELSGRGSKILADWLTANAGAGQATKDAQTALIWSQYGTQYLYDNAGRRIATIEPNGTDGNGNKTVYYYDKAGRLTHSINALGEVTQYTFNAFGEQTAATEVGTRVATTGLTGGLNSTLGTLVSNVLSTIKDSTTTQTYDLRGQVASVTDARGYASTRTYSAFGQVATSVQRIDAITTAQTNYAYDRRGNLRFTTELDLGNRIYSEQNYDAFSRVIARNDGNGKTTNFSYDRLGRQVLVTDPLTATNATSYDAFARTLSTTDGLGNVTSYTYDSANRKVTITTPEAIKTVTESNRYGQTVKVTNGRNAVTTYTYNADGQLLSTVDPAGTESTTYDMAGRVYETTDGRGIIRRTIYDAANRILTRTVDAATGGLALTTQYIYDAKGQAIWSKNPKGVWTKTEYNLKGEVTAVVVDPKQSPNWTTGPDDNATGLAIRTEYTYDARGKTLTVIEGAGSTQPKTTQYLYDAAGRRTDEIVDPTGLKIRTTYTYDAADNVVAKTDAKGNVTRYVYDANNEQIYSVDATGAVVKTEYDQEGRVSRTTAYANTISLTTPSSLGLAILSTDVTTRLSVDAARDHVSYKIYDKDGRLSISVDALGYATKRDYDNANNVTLVRRYATAVAAPTIAKQTGTLVSFSVPTLSPNSATDQVDQTVYDAANRAIWTIDANGYATQRSYDGNDNVISLISYAKPITFVTAGQRLLNKNVIPVIGTSTTAGDSMITLDAANDRVTNTLYDNANRVVISIDPEGYVTQNAYDKLGHTLSTTRFANKLGNAYSSGTMPQVIEIGGTVPPAGGASYVLKSTNDSTAGYSYDTAGRLTVTTNGLGNLTTQVYDSAGRVTDVTISDAIGGNASTTHYVFDAAGRVTDEIKGYRAGGLGQPDYANTRYVLDGMGNRTSIIDSRGIELAESDSAWAIATRKDLGYVDGNGNALPYTSLTPAQQNSLRARYTTTQVFDALSQVTQSTDPLGKSIYTAYNAFGKAFKVTAPSDTNPGGNTGYILFNKLNQATWSIDPMGYATQTNYDGFGQVSSIVKYANAVGNLSAFATNGSDVDAPALLALSTFNSMGGASGTGGAPYIVKARASDVPAPTQLDGTTTIVHDLLGRQTKITDAEQYVESMTYDAFGNKLTYANKLYDASNPSSLFAYVYDRDGNLIQETLPDKVYQYLSDGSIDPASKDANGKPTKSVINTYKYDSRGNRTQAIEAIGLAEQRVTTYVYDALDQMIAKVSNVMATYSTDTSGFINNTPSTLSNSGNSFTKTGTTSAWGDTAFYSVKPYAGGSAVTFTAGQTNTTFVIGLTSKTSKTNSTTTIDWGLLCQNGTLSVSQNGVTTVSNIGAYTSTDVLTIAYKGDAIQVLKNGSAIWSSTALQITQPLYAAALINTSGAQVNNLQFGATTFVNGIATNTVAPTELRSYDSRGNLIEVRDPSGGRTLSYYDAQNRKIAEIASDGALSIMRYNSAGDMVASTVYADPVTSPATPGGVAPTPVNASNGRTTTYQYDANHHLVKTAIQAVQVGSVNSASGAYQVSTKDLVSTKTYDATGNLTSEVDARGNTVWHYYDAAGNQIAQIDADRYVTIWTLDQSGNILNQKIYANKVPDNIALAANTAPATLLTKFAPGTFRETVFVRDRLGRVSSQTVKSVGASKLSADGKTLSADLVDSTTSFIYDGLGNVKQRTEATGEVLTWTYDYQGRERENKGANFADAAGTVGGVSQTVDTEFDGQGNKVRQLEVGYTPGTDERTTYFKYGANGQLLSKRDPNGTTTYFQYDPAGRVTKSYVSRLTADSTPTVPAYVTDITVYTYDGVGRQLKQSIYTVDGLNASLPTAPTKAQMIQTVEVQYDTYGEITGKSTYGAGADGQNNGIWLKPAAWQEVTAYDNAGRAIICNTGTGAVKGYVFDESGNATLSIESTGRSLAGMTITSMLGLKDVHLTASRYNARNQQIDTFELSPSLVMANDQNDPTMRAGFWINSHQPDGSPLYNGKTAARNDDSDLFANTLFGAIQLPFSEISSTTSTYRVQLKLNILGGDAGASITRDVSILVSTQPGATTLSFQYQFAAGDTFCVFRSKPANTDGAYSVNYTLFKYDAGTGKDVGQLGKGNVGYVSAKQDYINIFPVDLPGGTAYKVPNLSTFALPYNYDQRTGSSSVIVAPPDGSGVMATPFPTVSAGQPKKNITAGFWINAHQPDSSPLYGGSGANLNDDTALWGDTLYCDFTLPSNYDDITLGSDYIVDVKLEICGRTYSMPCTGTRGPDGILRVKLSFPGFQLKGEHDWVGPNYTVTYKITKVLYGEPLSTASEGIVVVAESKSTGTNAYQDYRNLWKYRGAGDFPANIGDSARVDTYNDIADLGGNLYIRPNVGTTAAITTLYYRTAGSNGAWASASSASSVGAKLDNAFVFNLLDNFGGNSKYEYFYVTADAAGNILRTQSGTLDRSGANVTAPIVTSDAIVGDLRMGGVATRALTDSTSKINLILNAGTLTSATLKYRVHGTNGSWIPASSPLTNFAAIGTGFATYQHAAVNTGSIAFKNWYQFDPNSLGLAANTTYDYMVQTQDSGSNTTYLVGQFAMDGAAKVTPTSVTQLKALNDQTKVQFNNVPTAVTRARVLYRQSATTNTWTSVDIPKDAKGNYTWSTTTLASSITSDTSFDFVFQTFDVTGRELSGTSGSLTLSNTVTNTPVVLNSASVLSAVSPLQLVLDNPSSQAIGGIRVYYRAKGVDAYQSVNATKVAGVNGFPDSYVVPFSSMTPIVASYDYYYVVMGTDGVTPLSNAALRSGLTLPTATSPVLLATVAPSQVSGDLLIGLGNQAQISHISQQTYNAYGEIETQTDALGNVTKYAYNTMGKLVTKTDPTTTITDEHGVQTRATPITNYYYDNQGREVGELDPNLHLTTYNLLAAGMGKRIVTSENDIKTDANGSTITGQKRWAYDKFADMRKLTDGKGAVTDYTYDKAHQAIKVEHALRDEGGNANKRATDTFTFDGLGHSLTHTTSPDNTTQNQFTDKTYYDALGRVWKAISPTGIIVTYDYAYDATINAMGIQTGGWKLTTKTTERTLNNQTIDYTDVFGHRTRHIDYGGHDFSYAYNGAGWLLTQTSVPTAQGVKQSISYDYYSNGLVKTITDNTLKNVTYYKYNEQGNKIFEGYYSIAGANTAYQESQITYDELNRIRAISDKFYSLNYEYDAVGNRRRVKAISTQNSALNNDYWYTYDNQDRLSISMGSLQTTANGNVIILGTTGIQLNYDLAGNRLNASYGKDGSTERYEYTKDGYLTNVYVRPQGGSEQLASARTLDLMGRVANYQLGTASNKGYTYDADGKTQSDFDSVSNIKTTYEYNLNVSGEIIQRVTAGTGSTQTNATITTTKYEYWDSAQQNSISLSLGSQAGISNFHYDANGHVDGVTDVDAQTLLPRYFTYVNNAQGLILSRNETATSDRGSNVKNSEFYFYVDGNRVGESGTAPSPVGVDYTEALKQASSPGHSGRDRYKGWQPIMSSNFDQNYQAISGTFPPPTSSRYVVSTNGEKLSTIARSTWGDATLWYLIADANGLTGDVSLTKGQTLVIPNKVTNFHNNYSTNSVYDPSAVLGDTTPTMSDPPPPPPKDKGCGAVGMVLMVVVAVVAACVVGPAVLSLIGPALGVGATTVAAGIGATIATGTAGGIAAGLAAAAVGAAAGSIASQLVGMATGNVQSFSWSAVGKSAVMGAISAGAGALAAQASSSFAAAGKAISDFTGISNNALGAMGNAVLSQQMSRALGLQRGKFDWASVAAAGASAQLTQGWSSSPADSWSGFGGRVATGLVSGALNDAFHGQKVQWSAIAANSFGSALGDAIVGSIVGGDQKKAPQWWQEPDRSKPLTKEEINDILKDIPGNDRPLTEAQQLAFKNGQGPVSEKAAQEWVNDLAYPQPVGDKITRLGNGIVRTTSAVDGSVTYTLRSPNEIDVRGGPNTFGKFPSAGPQMTSFQLSFANAVLDTPLALYNAGVGAVEAGMNLLSGALPGFPDYVPVLNPIRATYLNPDVSEYTEFGFSLLGAGLARSRGSSVVTLASTSKDVVTVGKNTVTWTKGDDMVQASGSLKEVFGGKTRSSAEIQAQAAAAAKGVDGDQGGHLVANRFMPNQGEKNLFPQNANFNNSAFKTLENDYARAINKGYEVKFEHTLQDFVGDRPGSVKVKYTVYDSQKNVVTSYKNTFKNQDGQKYTRRIN